MTTAGQDKLENRFLQKSVESFLLAMEAMEIMEQQKIQREEYLQED